MSDRSMLLAQVPHALERTQFGQLGTLRQGKVRDVYPLAGKDALLMVTTDRISAFDRVLGTVPCKGELLTGLTHGWFERTKDVCRNHILDRPDPSALVVRDLRPLPVEVVVRGHITASLWRDYEAGKEDAYGIGLPRGLKKDEAFEAPILTPTTKAEVGVHDQPISEKEILAKGLVTPKVWAEVREKAMAIFAAGQAWASSRGLVLVDTKYEFGLDASGGVWLIDEIHTPDSSRYWRRTPEGNKALDKEFLREWLMKQGFRGDGPAPSLPPEVRVDLALRYVELFETLEGRRPELHQGPSLDRLEKNLTAAGLLPKR